MTEELKPCPFCGNKYPKLVRGLFQELSDMVNVNCPDCGANSAFVSGFLIDANKIVIAGWNMRELEKWHKYPDEKPEKSGRYLVVTTDRRIYISEFFIYDEKKEGTWEYQILYWRELPPMPEVE